MDFENEESKVLSVQEDNPIEMNEINLGLRNLEDAHSDSGGKRDPFKTPTEKIGQRKNFTLKTNPMYPGQIYFVDSPSKLLKQALSSGAGPTANQGQQRILEEDSNDYDDDEYLTQSPGEDESLIKRPAEDDESDDIDIDKLDFHQRALLARINSLKSYLPEKYQNLSKKTVSEGQTVKSFKLERSPSEKTPAVAVEHDVSPEGKPPQASQTNNGQISGPGKLFQGRLHPQQTQSTAFQTHDQSLRKPYASIGI